MTKPALWTHLLPAALSSGLRGRPHLRQVVGNTGWLLADKFLRMAIGLAVGVLVARYLGPERFGLLGYASALVALFGVVAAFGMDSIVVRDLVREPQQAMRTLGSCAAIQFCGAVLAMVLSSVAVFLLRQDDATARLVVAILATALLFKTADAARFWFDARVQARYVVRAEFIAFAVVALVKTALVIAGAPLLAFAWAALAEAALGAMLLLRAYRAQGGALRQWRVDTQRARALLHDALPLFLSAAAATVYMRVDQVMLGQLSGDHAVGIYTAATRLSEAWWVVPMAVCSSVFPALLTNRRENPARYAQDLEHLFTGLTLLAFLIAIPVTLWAGDIVGLLYGEQYPGAAQILVVHMWAAVFVFHGVAGTRWFLSENLQRLMVRRTLVGCALNVALNLLLIPRHGALGAAWATLAAQAMATFFFNALSAKTRPLFALQLRALVGGSLWGRLHQRHG